MKRLFVLLLTILAIFSLQTGALAAGTSKIGVVDLQRCIRESNEGKIVQERLQSRQRQMQEELDKRQKELEEMQKELEKQSLMLSIDAREDKQKEYEKKQRDLGYFYQDINDELKKIENEARAELVNIFTTVVNNIGKRDKYDLITERSGILYFEESMDITNEVIKEMDKLHP